MRNYKTTFLLVIHLLLGVQLFAQTDSSYIYLDDPSGIRPSGSEQIALERAADSLVARIPSAYRDSFIVIETDIYPILHYTKEGSEEIWDRLKIKATQRKKYHLLLAKEFDNNGLVDIRWQLVLPKGSPFDCIDSTKSQIFFQEMNFEILRKKFSYDNIVKAIDVLEEHFADFLFTGFSSNCAYCPQKVGGLRYRLESLGFTGKPVKKIRVYGNGATESGYTYNKKVVVYPLADMDSIDIYNDQLSWQSELSSAMEDVYSEFTYYKTDGTGCEDLDKPLAIKNSGQLDIRDNQSYIYKNEVVVLDGGEGDSWVYVKESNELGDLDLFQKGKIHLIFLNNIGIDPDQVVNKVQYYFSLINISPVVSKYTPTSPNKFGFVHLAKKDAISVIGNNPAKIVEFVKDNYSMMMTGGFPQDGFIHDDANLEKGDAGNFTKEGKLVQNVISVIKTGTINNKTLSNFKSTKLDLVSYLIFHACGHNAGIVHGRAGDSYSLGKGFMMSGSCVLNLLRTNDINPNNCGSDYYPMKKNYGYNSFVEIIQENASDSDVLIINQIERIKNRYE